MTNRHALLLAALMALPGLGTVAHAQQNPAGGQAPADQAGQAAPDQAGGTPIGGEPRTLAPPPGQANGDASGSSSQPVENPRAGAGAGGTATTTTTTEGGATVETPVGQGQPQAPASAAPSGKKGPDAWMDSPQTWATFNGDLMAQKYSVADQITPQNVGNLQKVWEYHTGDVSDGSGDVPMSVWSATPLFVNDTLYIGTPFYRIIALEPDTGKEKWVFNPHAVLKALTQPDMKNRGVAYWQADEPKQGEACQKIVYIGTMDAKLYGVDADTGKPCQNFGTGGMVDVNQWNTVNDKWPLSLLQAATVYHDTLFLGWAGKDWTNSAAPPGTVFALDARTGKLKWMFHALPNEVINKTGTANVWASMSIDPKLGILYIPVSSPSPNYYGGNRKEKLPLATSVDGPRHRDRQGDLEPAARPSRPLGRRHRRAADAGRHPEGRQDHPGARPVVEAGLPLRAEPRHRRADLPDRGKAGAALGRSR